MYEELIYRIKGTDFERPDCTPFDCGAFGLLAEAGRAISALQSKNAEKDKRITRVEAERDAAHAAICTHCQDIPCQGEACPWWRGPQGAGEGGES